MERKSEPQAQWNVAYEYTKKVEELFDQATGMRRMCAYTPSDNDALNKYLIFVYHTLFPKLKPKMSENVRREFNVKWGKVDAANLFDITEFQDALYIFFEKGGYLGKDEENPYDKRKRLGESK